MTKLVKKDYDVHPFFSDRLGLFNQIFPAFTRTFDPLPDSLFSRGHGESEELSENDSEYVIRVEMPGLSKEDIKVNVKDGELTIEAEKIRKNKNEEKLIYSSIFYGSIKKTIVLPEDIKTEGSDAAFENGVLVVTLPKKDVAPAKQITVK